MAKNTNKFKSLFSGINRTGEQLINSVLNNANSSINSSDVDLINPSSDEKVFIYLKFHNLFVQNAHFFPYGFQKKI